VGKADQISVVGNKEDFALLAKAFVAKRGGKSLADRDNIQRTGKFVRKGTLSYELHATVNPDYEQHKFWGVGLDDLLNMLIASVPGIVEDNMREAAAVIIELKRADMEDRPVQDIAYNDTSGREWILTAGYILEAQKRVEKLRDKAAEVSKEFAAVLKTKKKQRGAVQIESVDLTLHKLSESPAATGTLM